MLLIIGGLLLASGILEDKINPIHTTMVFYFTTILVYILSFLFYAYNKVESIKAAFLKTFIVAFMNIVSIYAIDNFIKPTSIDDKFTITTLSYLLLTFIWRKKD